MRVLTTPLTLGKETDHTARLEARGGGIAVRSVYFEESVFLSGIPDYMAIGVTIDVSGAIGGLAHFREDRVAEVDDEDVRVTIGRKLTAWARTHGAGADERQIVGIKRLDVVDLFKVRFGVGDLTRAKIDGESWGCWRNYRIVAVGSTD